VRTDYMRGFASSEEVFSTKWRPLCARAPGD